MEIWDLYDKDRKLTGETAVRGEPLPEGRYHLVVHALFLNSKGETLLQRRAKEKDILPDIWSVIGGSAIAGEDSFTACVRETEEEMGFAPDVSRARLLMTERRDRPNRGFFRDVWLFHQDVPIESMTWQPGEVQDGMWMLPEKIKDDPKLWHDVNEMYFWSQAYPYLCPGEHAHPHPSRRLPPLQGQPLCGAGAGAPFRNPGTHGDLQGAVRPGRNLDAARTNVERGNHPAERRKNATLSAGKSVNEGRTEHVAEALFQKTGYGAV